MKPSVAQAAAQRAADAALQVLDPNLILARIDVNDLLDRIEINRLLDRVDITRLLGRIDLDSLAEQTDFGAIITKSSGTFAASMLDLMRSQAVSLDNFFARLADRFRRRQQAGPYAGIASRFAAYLADAGASTGVFLLALGAASFAAGVLTGHPVTWSRSGTPAVVAFGIWQFIYFAYFWGSGGKTVGMALLGVRVVRLDGDAAGPGRAVLRTLSFPLSFLLGGLGFAGILLGNKRRALHDVIAGTAVVYAWNHPVGVGRSSRGPG